MTDISHSIGAEPLYIISLKIIYQDIIFLIIISPGITSLNIVYTGITYLNIRHLAFKPYFAAERNDFLPHIFYNIF